MEQEIQSLGLRITLLSQILSNLNINSILWEGFAILRQRTLEYYFDLLPDERNIFGIEPRSVICIL